MSPSSEVTVVMTAFDAERHLARAIASDLAILIRRDLVSND